MSGAGRVIGQILLAIGLAMILRPSWHDLATTAVLAFPVAAIITRLRGTRARPAIPVLVAACVSAVVLALAAHGWLDHPRNVLLPLIASEIPGARLTLGAVELSQAHPARGVSKLAAGIHQLALMALGISVAATLVGADLGLLAGGGPVIPGHWIAPVGISVYVLGVALTVSALPRMLPAMLMVSYTAWGVLTLARPIAGGFTATVAASISATVVACAVHRFLRGPHPILTFNPVFRIIVPAGLALLNLTSTIDGPATDIGAVAFTFISAANGIVLGLILDQAIFRPHARR